jgi:anti-sigma B factor antagonist
MGQIRMLNFKKSHHNDFMVLSMAGKLDALTVPEIRPEIERIVTEGPRKVAVELSELKMIDSSGIAAVVSLFKRLRRQGGEMKIVGACGQPKQIFGLMGLDRALDIVLTLDDAARRF